MKKFYYKKEDSLDYTKPIVKRPARDFDVVRDELIKSFKIKTPIILRLDRRHTVNVDKDGLVEDVSRFRTASISSLDQLNHVPTLPRARARDVTKSMSEDVFSDRNYSTASTVVITETELSSSWLYKNMKAVANSKDENANQRPSASRSLASEPSLSPVMLQDPKMKPVPVPTTPRPEKISSRCCYLAIMMVISICSLGFMSTIGGIVYLEVFSNKSVAVNPTAETPLDALGLLSGVQSGTNSEETPHKIQNEVIPSSKQNEPQDPNKSVAITEDEDRKTVYILDFGKPLETDMTQYIDSTRTQIRMHEDKAVRYEDNSSISVEYHESYSNVKNIKENQSDTENGLNQIENMPDVAGMSGKDLDKLEAFLSIRINGSEDSVYNENLTDSNQFPMSDHSGQDLKKPESGGGQVSEPPSDHQGPTKHAGNQASNKDSTDAQHKNNSAENSEKSMVPHENILSQDENNSQDGELDESDVGYETMITAINEHIQEVSKQESEMFSNRNGDLYIPVSEDSSIRTEKPSRMQVDVKRPGLPMAVLPPRVQQVTPDPVPKRTVDFKLSLADAMKHLQVLDTQNKLPSSRAKSSKSKPKATRPLSGIGVEQERKDMEQKQYLQNLRLLFYNRMQ